MSNRQIHPFSNGCEFMDWNERNCCQCKKNPPPDHQGPSDLCVIENTFALASVCAGNIADSEVFSEETTNEVLRLLEWDGKSQIPSKCPQLDPVSPTR